jgi:vacuolar-type H+-ATPase catalytic subunit A/Vma1
MSEHIVFRMRRKERQAAERELISWKDELVTESQPELWKQEYDLAQMALDVQEAIQEARESQERDRQLFKRVVAESRKLDPKSIDQENDNLQSHFDTSLRMIDLLRCCVRHAVQCGHKIENAAELDRIAEGYRKWKEDLPELLAMSYAPVREVIHKRIAASLANPPEKSDWEHLFTDAAGSETKE